MVFSVCCFIVPVSPHVRAVGTRDDLPHLVAAVKLNGSVRAVYIDSERQKLIRTDPEPNLNPVNR